MLQCDPGHIRVHTAKRMWPYVVYTTSKWGLSKRISVRPQCILGTFTPVLGAFHLGLDHPRCMPCWGLSNSAWNPLPQHFSNVGTEVAFDNFCNFLKLKICQIRALHTVTDQVCRAVNICTVQTSLSSCPFSFFTQLVSYVLLCV